MTCLLTKILPVACLSLFLIACSPSHVVIAIGRDPDESRPMIFRTDRQYCLPYVPPSEEALPEMAAIPPDYALDYKVIAYVATDFAERLMAYNKRRETAHRLAYEAYLRNCTPEP